MQKTNVKYKVGDVVRITTDNSVGIITSLNESYLYVLFENYRCMPIKKELAEKTGKYFDLKIIWDVIHQEEEGYETSRL